MKTYKSHKIVQAAKIIDIELPASSVQYPLGYYLFTLDDGTKKSVSSADRFVGAAAGDYFVVYADGYQSISPAKAFEEGYKEIVPQKDQPATGGVAAPTYAAGDAPKITMQDITDSIASEHYFTAQNGVVGAAFVSHDAVCDGTHNPLNLLTFCVLELKNGYTVTGKSALVSAENFDADLGRKYAYEDAIEACWPLLGFALKDRLHRREKSLVKISEDVKRMADANESMIDSLSNISIVDSSLAGTFGFALVALKSGHKIARAGWNGNGMFAYMVPANTYQAQTGAAQSFFGSGGIVPYNAYMALKGADDTVSTWAPSGSDALAEDWIVLPD